MSNFDEFKAKVKEMADHRFHEKLPDIDEDKQDRVKRRLDTMINDESVIRGLMYEDNEEEVKRWIDELVDSAHQLVLELGE